jgi:hypothetical protein
MSNCKGSTRRPIQVSYQIHAKNWQKAMTQAVAKNKKEASKK